MLNLNIRRAQFNDLSELTNLCGELGYTSEAGEVRRRLEKIQNSHSDIILVAVEKGIVIGWIHVFSALRLESDPFAEIGGLVVSSKQREKGIGKILLSEAEKWAKENGFMHIRVRSRTSRIKTGQFYEKEGYIAIKEQNVFEKSLQ
jgi:N-acetylglutamate synthase-like GNAT family acetyltransferase